MVGELSRKLLAGQLEVTLLEKSLASVEPRSGARSEDPLRVTTARITSDSENHLRQRESATSIMTIENLSELQMR